MDELEQGMITHLKIEFNEIFNMRNVVITSLHDFINNFSKDGIAKVPKGNVSSLTQQMIVFCERLYEAKALPHNTPVHLLTGITRNSVTEFFGLFELILNTERVRHMESDGEKFNNQEDP